MDSIEGRNKQGIGSYNATFFASITATVTWQELIFEDSFGEGFDSRCIRITNTSGAAANTVQFSFDPRDVSASARKVHGIVDGLNGPVSNTVELKGKSATRIWIRRGASTDVLTRIFAWR